MNNGRPTSISDDRKFIASHTLGIQLSKSWEVGLTEMTVFQRDNGFDAQYLNPIILYRAVEQDNGSRDNALIGLHTNIRLGTQAEIYGQLLFDEFKFGELTAGDGWWANKQAIQAGGKWFGAFGQDKLDLGAEVNSIRPFTYGHTRSPISFVHYDQPLAHPWGANLQEVQIRAAYQLKKNWRLSGQFVFMNQGDVSLLPIPHIGSNILYPNTLRGRDYQYSIAEANAIERTFGQLRLNWRPFSGSNLHATYNYYSKDDSGASSFGQHGISFGFSMNTIQRASVF